VTFYLLLIAFVSAVFCCGFMVGRIRLLHHDNQRVAKIDELHALASAQLHSATKYRNEATRLHVRAELLERAAKLHAQTVGIWVPPSKELRH